MSEHISVSVALLQDVEDVMSDIVGHDLFDRDLSTYDRCREIVQRVGAVLNHVWAERRREEGQRESWDRSDLRTL